MMTTTSPRKTLTSSLQAALQLLIRCTIDNHHFRFKTFFTYTAVSFEDDIIYWAFIEDILMVNYINQNVSK